jgi:hypothetical protein
MEGGGSGKKEGWQRFDLRHGAEKGKKKKRKWVVSRIRLYSSINR